MREIKFRAFSRIFNEHEMFFDIDIINKKDGQWFLFNNRTRLYQSGERVAIMQFTGLYDENDKEIYEGDIIQDSSGNLLVVEWNDDTCKYQFNDGHELNDCKNYGTFKLVIGNIYENPELIK